VLHKNLTLICYETYNKLFSKFVLLHLTICEVLCVICWILTCCENYLQSRSLIPLRNIMSQGLEMNWQSLHGDYHYNKMQLSH